MLKRYFYLALAVVIAFAVPAKADNEDIFDVTTPTRVSVHDPSVVIGYKDASGKITGEKTSGSTEVYYIFGSHRAWARSTDMQNWETFTNNISTSYKSIFSKDAIWAAKGGNQGNTSGYDVTGNMWAPDVVWNKNMKKWCMYMSINGDNYYSSIVLLTAETLDGDWTRVGPVVYSGFLTKSEAQSTDFYTVYSGSDLPDRYANGAGKYTLNAIDPCAFFDEDGNMWMTYGSWFGGLYMLRLDEKTGLRDYTYTYETTDGTAEGATSDEYMGLKVAGGNGCSGEASYIQYIKDRYYLFVTYGGLTSVGGYNMRVFQSKDVKGPYTDLGGRPAIYSTSNTAVGGLNRTIGIQLMNYYKWDTMNYGYVAEGHNSAIVDDDGKIYLVYHTRSTTWANEGHEVRVHQMFTTEDGGLVAAPFEYRGETLATSPYSTDDIVGTYKVIYHAVTDYANKVCNTEKTITLNADGTVTGDYSGTWSQSSSSPEVTIDLGTNFGGAMKGVFIKQKMEGLNYENLCFTVVGSYGRPLWGYKSTSDAIVDALSDKCTSPIKKVLATYATIKEFNGDGEPPEVDSKTGLSLSFYVSGLTSDWTQIATSLDEKYVMYLSILHYNSADLYEAKATVSDEATALGYTSDNVWGAFLNGGYYVTISFNPDGTISYYRDGVLMLTYAADATPSWNDTSVNGSGSVTPASIVKAVIDYYYFGELDFTQNVYNIQVGYSVPYDNTTGISNIKVDNSSNENAPRYNLSGQRVGKDYKGLVIQNSKKTYVK